MPIMPMLLRSENNFSKGHLVQQGTIEHVGTFKKEMPGKINQDYIFIILKSASTYKITLLNCFFIPPMEGMWRLLRAPPNNDILILWNKDLDFSSLHILEPMLILNRCYQQGLSATTNLCPIHKKLSCFQHFSRLRSQSLVYQKQTFTHFHFQEQNFLSGLLLSSEEFNLHIEPHFKTTWNKHRAGSSNFVIRRMGAITSHKCFKRSNTKYCSLPARCCVFMSVGIPIKCQGILLVAGISFICKTLSQTRRSDIHLIWTWTFKELQNKMLCPEFVNVVEVVSAYQSSGVQNIGQILINTPEFVRYVKANR